MPRNNRNWTPDEEKRMVDLLATGKSMAAVAKELGRTEAAVSNRASTFKNRLQLGENSKR